VRGHNLVWAKAATLNSEEYVLYIIATFDDRNTGPTGIIKRTGLPGHGIYELEFLSYRGPYFQGLDSYATRVFMGRPWVGNAAEAVGVGKETSVVFDGGSFLLEKLPYRVDLKSVISAGKDTEGFYAVGYNLIFSDYELLYHP